MEGKKEVEVEIQREDSPKISKLAELGFISSQLDKTGQGERRGEVNQAWVRDRGAEEQVQGLWCLLIRALISS